MIILAPKIKNFVILVRFNGYISHIDADKKEFVIDVDEIPLDKKKHRLIQKNQKNNDDFSSTTGKFIATIHFDEIPEKDKDKIQLGQIFNWYLGYTWKRYKGRVPVSKFIFIKKYGKNGKRINMKEVERAANEMYSKIKWS